jgi:hypothetical protein
LPRSPLIRITRGRAPGLDPSDREHGREVYLVWRWDIFDPERVFPITAYFLPDEG